MVSTMPPSLNMCGECSVVFRRSGCENDLRVFCLVCCGDEFD